MNQGKYIVLEGMDGSGKTTQFELLQESLGRNVLMVREPGGTEMAEHIRKLLKDKTIARSPKTNSFLFAAARADLIDQVVAPAIARGQHVLSDRNWLSTLAYQSAEGADVEHIIAINKLATNDFFDPDLIIMLDLDPKLCQERQRRRGNNEADYFEHKGEAYFKAVRQGYLEGIKQFSKSLVIDASPSPEQVAVIVQKAIEMVM